MDEDRVIARQYPVSKRVLNINASATKEMAIIAARLGGCVSLGQGVPSFCTPPHIIKEVTRVLTQDPTSGHYSLQTGMPALRQEIAGYLLQEKKIKIDPESEVCVTVGGMEALLATVLTVVNPGDEVILPTPTYASYFEQVQLAGGVPVHVPLTLGWGLDLQAIRSAVTPKTCAIMLCNPGNPTGTVFSDSQTIALCELALTHNFVVITDEAYDYIVYDGSVPCSPFSLDKYREKVISVYSLSKKYALSTPGQAGKG